MNRRALLVGTGLGIAGIAGISGVGWRITRDDLTVGVRNITTEERPVTIDVSSDGESMYTDSFAVPADQTIEWADVVSPGEYTLQITLDDREDRDSEYSVDTRFCHEARVIFEIDVGNALAVYSDCQYII